MVNLQYVRVLQAELCLILATRSGFKEFASAPMAPPQYTLNLAHVRQVVRYAPGLWARASSWKRHSAFARRI